VFDLKWKILACDPLDSIGIQKLRNAGFDVDVQPNITSEELRKKIRGYHAIIVRGRTKVTRDVLKEADELRVVARAGAGLDNIDLKAAEEFGIQVVSASNASTVSVAELTIGLILDVLRQIPTADEAMKKGSWPKKKIVGRELRGKTVGIIGVAGRIGSEVARILKEGFQANVVGYDIVDAGDIARKLQIDLAGSLEELLSKVDIVTIHVPYTDGTHHLINKGNIALMRDGVILVNTSRGDVVDGRAVLEALKSKKLSGAALDVYHDEPPEEDWEKELVSLPDGLTVCTCHIGSQTLECQEAGSIVVAEEIIRIFKEKK